MCQCLCAHRISQLTALYFYKSIFIVAKTIFRLRGQLRSRKPTNIRVEMLIVTVLIATATADGSVVENSTGNEDQLLCQGEISKTQ